MTDKEDKGLKNLVMTDLMAKAFGPAPLIPMSVYYATDRQFPQSNYNSYPSTTSTSEFSHFGGGPDVGMQGTGMQSAVDLGIVSQETANFAEGLVASMLGFQQGQQGYEPTVMGMLGIPSTVANPIGSIVGKGLSALGRGGWNALMGALGFGTGGYGVVGPDPGLGFGGWGPIGDLAGGWGADYGGGGYGGGDYGGFGDSPGAGLI